MEDTALSAGAHNASTGVSMPSMPLSFLHVNESATIVSIHADEKLHHHLENMGFVEGASVTIASQNAGNIIVQVKGASIGLDKNMSRKIIVG